MNRLDTDSVLKSAGAQLDYVRQKYISTKSVWRVDILVRQRDSERLRHTVLTLALFNNTSLVNTTILTKPCLRLSCNIQAPK